MHTECFAWHLKFINKMCVYAMRARMCVLCAVCMSICSMCYWWWLKWNCVSRQRPATGFFVALAVAAHRLPAVCMTLWHDCVLPQCSWHKPEAARHHFKFNNAFWKMRICAQRQRKAVCQRQTHKLIEYIVVCRLSFKTVFVSSGVPLQ